MVQYGYINVNKKKKKDAYAVMIDQGCGPAPTYNKPHSYQQVQTSTFQNRPYVAPRAHPDYEIKTTRNYTKIDEPLVQLFEKLKTAGKIPDLIPNWFDIFN
ncbi:hypothetical protein H5410_014868 [Solanum commersonii]|uniref:Uncharacterized protein n=1 Tax=Solanum commersonii TaxID=4109 RepID=A0A9J5ZSQ2_SOLCO|nr:hypothetical protein H5410_014868 [Solanum commersonii]